MESTIGKNINAPDTWARSDRFVNQITLVNGNIENEYLFNNTCRYFFEFEKTGTVISWRYEGDVRDCEINP